MLSYTIGLNIPVYFLHPILAGSRYFFIPLICIIWALIDLTSDNSSKFILSITFLYYGYLSINDIPRKKYLDKNWKAHAKKLSEIKENEIIVIPINPEGWTITIKK